MVCRWVAEGGGRSQLMSGIRGTSKVQCGFAIVGFKPHYFQNGRIWEQNAFRIFNQNTSWKYIFGSDFEIGMFWHSHKLRRLDTYRDSATGICQCSNELYFKNAFLRIPWNYLPNLSSDWLYVWRRTSLLNSQVMIGFNVFQILCQVSPNVPILRFIVKYVLASVFCYWNKIWPLTSSM